MAAQPSAPVSSTWSFDLTGHLQRRFGIGARNWDRFAEAADSVDGKFDVPASGAHVTLKDLARDPSSIASRPKDDSRILAAMENDNGWVGTPDPTKFAPGTTDLSPQELQEEIEKGNVMLWKDLKKRVAELSGDEREALQACAQKRILQERYFVTLQDGSKVSLWDLYEYVENNPELKAMYERRRDFPMANPDDPAGRPLPAPPASALERSAALPEAVMSPEEANELELDWGHLGRGAIWRRRPTRWLRGIDGVKDWDVEVYAHEPMANQVLGRKYGGRDPFAVVQEDSYARDIIRCGPLLGMTFVLTAARDLPLREAASSFRDLLTSYLQRQAPLTVPRRLRPYALDTTDLNGVTWPRHFLEDGGQQADVASVKVDDDADSDELGVSWRQMGQAEHEQAMQAGVRLLQSLPETLYTGTDSSTGPFSGTPLVDSSGRTWRKGGSLWITLEPEGEIVLQAQSAGLVGEQESFLLTRLEGQEALSSAVMDAFLGPQPLDPQMAAAARSLLLLPANGFTAGNRDRDPNHPMFPGQIQRHPKVPADPAAFRLVPPTKMEQLQPGQCGTLLSGIREIGVANEIHSLLFRAYETAVEVAAAPISPSGISTEASIASTSSSDELQARQVRGREAALRVLREGLAALGPEARSIMKRAVETATSPAGDVLLPEVRAYYGSGNNLVPDLFNLARTLDASDEAQDCV